MEHLRFAVVADPPQSSTTTPNFTIETPTTTSATPLDPSPSPLDDYGIPTSIPTPRQHLLRPSSPTSSNPQKRTDPFTFGSRYLTPQDDIFTFNAWDHVSLSPDYLSFSETQYTRQRADPVSAFDRARFNANPEKWWNLFYRNNRANFFKDRKWLAQEFPVLDDVGKEDAGEVRVLEVGAGAGNTAFPILQRSRNPNLRIHACDFSKKAVELIREHELYDGDKIRADVWDVASPSSSDPANPDANLPPGLTEGSVDVIILIFIFSALHPSQWEQAVRNVHRLLKPGGQLLFRDYGRGDLAQVRFKKGRYMQENFYVRGDGTRVYFFEKEELQRIWSGGAAQAAAAAAAASSSSSTDPPAQTHSDDRMPEDDHTTDDTDAPSSTTDDTAAPAQTPSLETIRIGVDNRMLVNRQRRLKMYRCWLQAVFRKQGHGSRVPVCGEAVSRDAEVEVEAEVEAEAEAEGVGEGGGEGAVAEVVGGMGRVDVKDDGDGGEGSKIVAIGEVHAGGESKAEMVEDGRGAER